MNTSMDKPVAVITGAASGMGKAGADRLRSEGWRVIGIDRDAADGSVVCDITSSEQVEDAIREIGAAEGRIDALVNAAGWGVMEPFLSTTDERWWAIFDVNVMGTVRMCRAAMPYLLESDQGAIVNFTSQAGKTGGLAIGSAYPAAKAAIISLTKSLAREFSPQGVRVNAIAPGVIETPFLDKTPAARDAIGLIPLGRLGRADEAAGIINFLLSDDSSYLTGEIIDFNGGLVMD